MTFEYEQFIRTIQHKAEASWDEGERAAAATLTTLAERLSAGEARDVADELPPEARHWLAGAGDDAEAFTVEEFLRRVAEREDVDLGTAERHARAVFVAVTRNLSRQELRDMMSELPKDFGRLLSDPERSPVPEPLPTEEFLARVADHAAVDLDTARAANGAVLATLAERIAGGEVDDLAEQLSDELRRVLERAKTRKAERMSLDEFVQRVAEREGVSPEQAHDHVRAVFQTLREAVTGDEWADMTAELPDEYTPVLMTS
jgi:uncharacterized protein (DUF2267 family)